MTVNCPKKWSQGTKKRDNRNYQIKKSLKCEAWLTAFWLVSKIQQALAFHEEL
jgi:hypothetical protein